MNKLKAWANSIKRDVYALYLAARDSRVPWFAKALALATAAYALSPIDLIPDFIPVLGYLDDIVIVPLAIVLTVRLIPAEVMLDLRLQAEQRLALAPPSSRTAAVIIVLIWIVAAIVAARLLWR
jgi:uncharacterized membrane protein YkvA (DUF1232 family)